MRILPLAAAVLAISVAFAIPAAASAQGYGYDYGRAGYGSHYGGSRVARENRECRRALREADSRRDYARAQRECRQERRGDRDDRYRDDRRGW